MDIPEPVHSTTRPVEPSDPELHRRLLGRCAYWQEVLQLQDWRIDLRIARSYDMGTDNAGEINALSHKRMAIITIRDPIDADPAWMEGSFDPELSLIHELCHIHLAPFAAAASKNESTLEHVTLEQAVHALSYALFRLDRATRN